MDPINRIASIQNAQDCINALFGGVNKRRGGDYIYGYLSRNVAYLGKGIAKGRTEVSYFIRSLSWLLALANFYKIDAQSCFFSRFPKICPYCLSSPCACFKTNKMPPKYIPAYKAKEELLAKYGVLKFQNNDWSFSYGAGVISGVYPNNEVVYHFSGPWHLIAKMQEEVAEIHEAISNLLSNRKKISAVEEVMSDIMAWILGAWAIIHPGRNLDEEFIDYYSHGCPVCLNSPCICKARSDRPAELISGDALEKISNDVKELEAIIPAARTALDELMRSISFASSNQEETTTNHALKNTKAVLDSIKGNMSTADEMGQKGISIINRINDAIEVIMAIF